MIENDDGTTEGNAIEVVKSEVLALHVDPDYKISNSAEAVSANEALSRVKMLNKKITDAKSNEIVPLNDQIKAVRERYREAEALLIQAEDTLKRAIVTFRQDENKRLEAQRQLEAAAAAKERARLEEQARKEREKAEATAAALRAKGQEEKADAVLQNAESSASAKESVAAMVAAPTKSSEPTALAGASFRENWTAKVTDLPLFLKSLSASNYDLDDVIAIKPAGLNRLAKSLKGNMDKALPGAIAWPESTMAARAK